MSVVPPFPRLFAPSRLCSCVPPFLCASVPAFLCSSVPSCRCSVVPASRCPVVPSFSRPFAPPLLRSFAALFCRPFMPSFLRSLSLPFILFDTIRRETDPSQPDPRIEMLYFSSGWGGYHSCLKKQVKREGAISRPKLLTSQSEWIGLQKKRKASMRAIGWYVHHCRHLVQTASSARAGRIRK